MKKIVIITIMFVCLGCVLAYADFTVEEYEKMKNQPTVEAYFTGVGKGVMWANVVFQEEYGKQLYCQPDKLALRGSNYKQILDNVIKELRQEGKLRSDSTVELLMIIGLQRTFPCPK